MVALLTRTTGGDIALAEDMLQQALLVALEKWPVVGWPNQPIGWLLRVARNKAIDQIRRRANFASKRHLLTHPEAVWQPELPDSELPDERLRLIFTCCHPALNLQAQIALTMRSVCGLTTPEIARAFLVPVPTLAQRLARAQRKIRDAKVPYIVPEGAALEERLDAVLHVVYLVFTEGYGASGGAEIARAELGDEAIRLGRLLVRSVPLDGEIHGLLALMLLQDARREARAGPDGELVLLKDQDRQLWKMDQIAEGGDLIRAALRRGPPGPYTLQAIIASLHALAPRYEDTDWAQIVGVYDLLLRALPSPVVALNRAAALAMRDGPEAGLAQLDLLDADGRLAQYHLLPAARAELLRRLGHIEPAKTAYIAALALCSNPREIRFLKARLAGL